MLLTGILLSLSAGLFWNMSGIVNSTCARKKYDLYSYLLTNVIFSALFTGILAGSPAGLMKKELILFIAVITVAGAINTSGALLLQKALQNGHHGIIFLIAQSAPAIPFIVGMVFLGDTPTWQKVGGVLLILSGMVLAALPKFRDRNKSTEAPIRKWLVPTLFSFACFGIAHSLLALPSLMDLPAGAGAYRTFLLYCGSSVLVVSVTGFRSRTGKLSFNRMLLLIGVIAAVLNVCSMAIFFKAVDFLAQAKAVGLGSPLATSASLVGFTLYSWFYLREKRETAAFCGLICICAGAVTASL
ncbi:MAG: EamA family transporter [Lentisphaeria bacterium]|nr:EamA family transporter [Lentisphaeria bacterium]